MAALSFKILKNRGNQLMPIMKYRFYHFHYVGRDISKLVGFANPITLSISSKEYDILMNSIANVNDVRSIIFYSTSYQRCVHIGLRKNIDKTTGAMKLCYWFVGIGEEECRYNTVIFNDEHFNRQTCKVLVNEMNVSDIQQWKNERRIV